MDFGFFGIGTWELLVIAVLALIILGPRQMILLARKAGEMLRQFQQVWQDASKTLDREFRAIEEDTGSIGSIGKEFESLANDVKSAMSINLPTGSEAARPQPSGSEGPRPQPVGVEALRPPSPATPTTLAPASPWTSSPAPAPAPATPPATPPAEKPASADDAQPPAPSTSAPEPRYPAWTSKPHR
jgi:sec-independent protein translocase protein TatB